jgi:hypothetical protein
MKSMTVSETINKVMNSKLSCNYLKLINIGMLIFHKNSRVSTVIKNTKFIDNIDDTFEILNSNRFIVSATKDNKLYISILDKSNKFELLESLLIDINYYFNIKYKNINDDLLFDYINIIECEEITKLIISSSSLIDDKEIIELFDEMNLSNDYKNYDNQLQVNAIRPLYDFIKENNIKYKDIILNKDFEEINKLMSDNQNLEEPYKISENYRVIKNIIKKISSC